MPLALQLPQSSTADWFSTVISLDLRTWINIKKYDSLTTFPTWVESRHYGTVSKAVWLLFHFAQKGQEPSILDNNDSISLAKMSEYSNFLSSIASSMSHVSVNSVNSGCHTSITREAGIASTGTIRLTNPSALDGRKGETPRTKKDGKKKIYNLH